METKDKPFQMRLTPRESNALEALAKRKGISKTEYLRRHLRAEAKKARIPI
jgi:predicted HicB family RNase H-like nuclease